MNRLRHALSVIGLAVAAATLFSGCGGTYASYTEYRSAPVKSAAEIRDDEIRHMRRARDMPGGAGEQRAEGAEF